MSDGATRPSPSLKLVSGVKSLVRGAVEFLPPPRSARRAVVLCYHSVHPAAPFASATPELFDAQLKWLQEHCDVISLRDLDAARRELGERPLVALTFDDGYVDNYQFAFPRLRKRGLTATLFLTAGFIERDPMVVGRMGRLWGAAIDEVEALTWAQVREMRDGGMEFGSHTWSHPNLTQLDDEVVGRELVTSREAIEAQLGEAVDALAYPFGKPKRHVTDSTIALAAGAGYALGVIVLPRGVRSVDSPLRIPRFTIGWDTPEELAAKVSGRLDGHGVVHERAPAWLDRMVSGGDDVAVDEGMRP